MIVSLSMNYVVWMVTSDQKELSNEERLWVETFISLWKKELSNSPQDPLRNAGKGESSNDEMLEP